MCMEESDHPLPPPDEELEESNTQEPDLQLSDQPLFDHLCKGHQPYLSSCEACSRACGRIPARRVKHPKGPYEIAGPL